MFSLQKSFDTKIAIINKTNVFLKLIARPKIVEYAAYFSQMFFSTNVYVKLCRFWNCNLRAHTFDNCNSVISIFSIYLFINYYVITNYILIIYELNNFGNRCSFADQSRWWESHPQHSRE